MTFTTTAAVPAPRERVFAALVNPDVLQRCIPGCEEFVALDPDTYRATLKIGVAGLNGKYRGTADVREKQSPDSFSIHFDGKGTTGFVRGTALISLTGDETIANVACDVDVEVGGAIAAVGSRLIQATAKKLAADFFRQIADAVEARS